MRFSSAVAALTSAVLVRAADHAVKVGANGLAFTPNVLTGVQNGDTVTFEFHPKNHSVTQSTFDDPCQQSAGGVNSGYLATDPAATQFSQWQITIDDASKPIWMFCAQVAPAVHCHSGMVFAVNPTADKTFEQYQLNANQSTKAFTDAGQPAQPTASGNGAAPAGQTQAGQSQAGQTSQTGGAGATGVPTAGSPSGVAGNTAPVPTTSGSVPTNAIPSPASVLTTSGGLGAGGNAQGAAATGAPGGPAGSSAGKVSVGFSGLMGVAVILGFLL